MSISPAFRPPLRRAATLACVAVVAACGLRPTSAPAPTRILRREVDALLADARYRNAHLGVLIVDPARGDTLYSHNAGKLFIPASNQKLLTGAAALSILGPDFRFSTTFFADGAVSDGVLQGNLRVVGTGDPSVSDHMTGDAMLTLQQAADSLAARGITRVAGALVPGGDAFPDAVWGFGWSWDDMDFPYSAGVDELLFNEGFMELAVRAGARPGEAVSVRTRPNARFPLVRSRVVTVARDTTRRVRPRVVARHDTADVTAVILEGEIVAGDSQTVALTYRDQPRAYLEALHTALDARGIAVGLGVAARAPVAGADTPPLREPPGTALFSLVSPPLSAVLVAFEKASQNQIGEILLKSLGRSRTGVGSADSGAVVVRDQLLAWGASPHGFSVRDGSGLSRYDVVSPETIIRVLDAMRRSPHAGVFHDALPIAGVDGTIRTRMRGTTAESNVHAKTGTLNMVRSLSGYVTTADGRPLIFSLLANHFTVPTRDIDALHDAIVVRLAQMRGGR